MPEKKQDSSQLDKALESLLDTFEKSKDFAFEQIPQVIQELIIWKRVWFTSECLAFLAVGICLFLMCRKHIKLSGLCPGDTQESKDEDNWHAFISVVSGILSAGFLFIAVPISFYWASMVWFAPRVYILEYISDMIKRR